MGHRPQLLIDQTYVHKTVKDLQRETDKLEEIFDLDKMMSLISSKYYENNYQYLTFSSIDNLLIKKTS